MIARLTPGSGCKIGQVGSARRDLEGEERVEEGGVIVSWGESAGAVTQYSHPAGALSSPQNPHHNLVVRFGGIEGLYRYTAKEDKD